MKRLRCVGPVAFIGDVHLGNHKLFGGATVCGRNRRFEQTLRTLTNAINYCCSEYHVRHIAFLGDLFDTHRPTPQMLDSVISLINRVTNVGFIMVAGNHDKSSELPRDNALAPLEGLNDVTLVDTEPVLLGPGGSLRDGHGMIMFAPYRAGPAARWVEEDLASYSPIEVYATHVGLIDSNTPPWLRNASDAVPEEIFAGKNVKRVIAGNWHKVNELKSGALQIGALVPTGFDNPSTLGLDDEYGRVEIVGTPGRGKDGKYVIFDGPRFYIESYEALGKKDTERWAKIADYIEHKCTNYLKLTAKHENLSAARIFLESLFSRGWIKDGLVEPSKDSIAQRQARAAKAATSAETIGESVDAYVRSMKLEGVDADDVVDRSLAYLKRARGRSE